MGWFSKKWKKFTNWADEQGGPVGKAAAQVVGTATGLSTLAATEWAGETLLDTRGKRKLKDTKPVVSPEREGIPTFSSRGATLESAELSEEELAARKRGRRLGARSLKRRKKAAAGMQTIKSLSNSGGTIGTGGG